MNAKEAYIQTLENLEILKKEQLTEINAKILRQISRGEFSYISTDSICDETKNDLISRGFRVVYLSDETNFLKILWD